MHLLTIFTIKPPMGRPHIRKSGFTLIELLVVIAIIVIAASIVVVSGGGGGGVALSSSERIVAGIAQGARGQAILKNAETRLIIHNDPADPEKYRRYFGIVYWGEESDGLGGVIEGWIAATQGTYLPDGIFFDPSLSRDYVTSNMSLDYPRAVIGANTNQAGGGGSEAFLTYGFNSNGTSMNPNQWLTLRGGFIGPDGNLSAYDANGEDGALKAALIFRRAGTTTSVSDPEDI